MAVQKMSLQTPVLSIITPLYNRAWCIAECIASAGLAGHPVEMIIVDDGSSDGSVMRAREAVATLGLEAQVRIVEQANAGPSAARNRAAHLASGEWLVFLDSDDLWFPWTVPTLLKVLSGLAPEVTLAFAAAQNFSDPSELETVRPEPAEIDVHPSFVAVVRHNPVSRYGACNAAMRRTDFLTLGGFAPELRCAEDTDLFLRSTGHTALIRKPVLAGLRRSGHESLTGNIPEVIKGFEWMRSKQGSGVYRGTADELRSFIAGSCAYSIRAAFASGHVGSAYRLYFENFTLLANTRTRKYLLRLPLTPLLHLRNPRGYPFRLTSARE